ncbi:NmrA family NAD(P)-binding protein [Jannaschia sp. R86511]|uniref:NmrA family NAD(P)-binding protein n=1 Tax=Jannaschia sp. R86511 TaxID=3093853 RepID=UPI0036D28015
MSIVVTGATGPFGRHVVTSLLDRGAEPGDLLATGRRVETLADLAERGVRTARLDFDDPESMPGPLEGARTVLLVSGPEVGRRVPQHEALARAAATAGASRLVYTSVLHADVSPLSLAPEHLATERFVVDLDVAPTFLRNGWYYENYTAQLPVYLQTGAVLGAAGDGRVSGALRAELAEAAAVVLLEDGHEGATYELGADTPFTMTELAETVTRVSGTPVGYRDLPVDELAGVLQQAGLPEPVATMLAGMDLAIRDDALLARTGDLARLLGRTPATLEQAVRAALA